MEGKFKSALKQTLKVIFQKMLGPRANVDILVRLINDNQVNAEFLARYIAIRLQQGVKVRKVLNTIKRSLNGLMDKKLLLGFRIKLSGRFSRVQQASCSIGGDGILSRNEVTSDVDYAFRTANLKFSVCGVKVLLARPLSTALPPVTQSKRGNDWVKYISAKGSSNWQRDKLLGLLEDKKQGLSKDLMNNTFYS